MIGAVSRSSLIAAAFGPGAVRPPWTVIDLPRRADADAAVERASGEPIIDRVEISASGRRMAEFLAWVRHPDGQIVS